MKRSKQNTTAPPSIDMQEISLVFPHQLFDQHPAISKDRKIWLIEEPLYFKQFSFHQQKILLHRASMKYYASLLQSRGYEVQYVDHHDPHASLSSLFDFFAGIAVTVVHYADTVDYLLERRMERYAQKHGIRLRKYASSNFICNMDELNAYFSQKKRYFLTDFYIHQRKRLNILLHDGEPLGGKWTYDTENRKKMPTGTYVPPLPVFKENDHVKAARQYVKDHFSDHYGSADVFNYPVTHQQAQQALGNFLQERFTHYGIYQDAIIKDQSFLFHSLLTPALNIGLLEPMDIIQQAIGHAAKHDVPLNSLEGFVRQILGWREFVRAVYVREGVKERTRNFWGFKRKIPASFWKGETGIELVDAAIRGLLRTGYNHHIERLMVIGNFMCLCEFDPDDVYRWFMEMYIDAYDWVMVPNVYGMSQFADGGLMATKPYISGSNYILKMSDHKKGKWCEIWDALFWRFLHVHRDFFSKNPRLSMLVKTFDKMPAEKREKHISVAEKYLSDLGK